ncbi:MAG: ClbS/DfsB family four-helix bundle protein, partial [Microvirgula sp.]
MPIPANQRELLDAIRTRYAQLDAELRTVPPAQAFEPTLEGHVQGTLISVADLVAYLLGWNLLVLKWCAGRDAGRTVDFPDTG